MPKLYTYLGITIFFYSKEHRPIQVHGRKDGRESVVEVFYKAGEVSSVRARSVTGKQPLREEDLKLLRDFMRAKGTEIADLWNDYFVLQKKIKAQTITRKVKP